MNQITAVLLIALFVVYFPALGLFHLMILRVNRRLPTREKIPHSLYWGGWRRLRDQYKGFYPRSSLYELTLSSSVFFFILAIAIVVFRVWAYVTGR